MTRVPSAQHPLVAREGYGALLVTTVVGIVLYLILGAAVAMPAVPAFLFLCFHFRDPHRDSPSLPLALVAPVDGIVTDVGPCRDPWLGRDAQSVAIAMGLFDVHSLFSPLEGKIIEQWSEPRHADSSQAVPRRAIAYLVRTDEGDDVVLQISAGQFGRSLRFTYQPGERVGHGRRIAYAKLGCHVTIFAAAGTQLNCSLGERVSAAATVIATLVHNTPVSAISHAESGTDNV